MSAHDAAVRAVAEALDALFEGRSEERLRRDAEVALAALATDPDVRAALHQVADEVPMGMRRFKVADAILAALRPPEALDA